MALSIFRTKEITPHADTGLKKCLTAFDLGIAGDRLRYRHWYFRAQRAWPLPRYPALAVVLYHSLFAGIAAGFRGARPTRNWRPPSAIPAVPMVTAMSHSAKSLHGSWAGYCCWNTASESAAVANGLVRAILCNTLANFGMHLPEIYTKAPMNGRHYQLSCIRNHLGADAVADQWRERKFATASITSWCAIKLSTIGWIFIFHCSRTHVQR